jgi:hypothetical protein
VSVAVNGDLLDEANETFVVNLASPVNATVSDAQGLGTITDDDAPAALSVSDVTVTEGNAGTVNAVFTVTLTPASGLTVGVDFATANGTATSGADYSTTSGTLSFAPGATTQSVTVTVTGDVLDEPDETFFLNLANPANGTVADAQGLGTITDDDAPAALSIADVAVTEGDTGTTQAVFTLTLAPVSGQTVTLDYATADGTATAGTDYTAAAGSVTFAPGVTTQAVSVDVIGDVLTEPSETFLVNLANAGNATVSDGQAVGTINDNDAASSLTVDDIAVTEGNSGVIQAVFTVSLAPANAQAVTVDFATADGTATAGTDYTAASGALTFAPGSATQTVSVDVTGDVLDEPDETFALTLTNPTNANVGDGEGLGTITDDDPAATVSISVTSVREGPNGTTSPADFTVTVAPVSGQTVSVEYATSNGTASLDSDYEVTSGVLTFAPGTTAAPVSVNVFGDDLREPDEVFFLDLSNPINAVLGIATGSGTIQNDDSWPELTHGLALLTDLRTQPGPTADTDEYQISQRPGASYEVVVDSTSGDLGPSGPSLERVAADGVTVLQSSLPAGSGSSRSLRWENAGALVDDETLRVTAPSCWTACGPEAVYRVRLLDTTAGIPRFNNSATQATIVVVQNLGADPVSGTFRFWGTTGTLLASQPFTIASHGAVLLNTLGIPALVGQGGSVTIASDAPYGGLSGKAVAVEPATGFTFDTAMTYRVR